MQFSEIEADFEAPERDEDFEKFVARERETTQKMLLEDELPNLAIVLSETKKELADKLEKGLTDADREKVMELRLRVQNVVSTIGLSMKIGLPAAAGGDSFKVQLQEGMAEGMGFIAGNGLNYDKLYHSDFDAVQKTKKEKLYKGVGDFDMFEKYAQEDLDKVMVMYVGKLEYAVLTLHRLLETNKEALMEPLLKKSRKVRSNFSNMIL